MRMVRIVNQKQSSKDSIPVYLYITTWCVRPWHFAPSTQKFSSFSQGKRFSGYSKTVMTRYMHLRSQLFLLKPIPWNSVQTSVRNLTTTTALGLDHLPRTDVTSRRYGVPTQTVWPAVDNCGTQRYTYFWIFSSLLPELETILKTSWSFEAELWCSLALLSVYSTFPHSNRLALCLGEALQMLLTPSHKGGALLCGPTGAHQVKTADPLLYKARKTHQPEMAATQDSSTYCGWKRNLRLHQWH